MSEPVVENGPDELSLDVESMVSAFDGSPFVRVAWGDRVGMLTPNATRGLALVFMEAAESAEHDAVLTGFLASLGTPEGDIGMTLLALRSAREQRFGGQT